jgi:streptogrisin D
MKKLFTRETQMKSPFRRRSLQTVGVAAAVTCVGLLMPGFAHAQAPEEEAGATETDIPVAAGISGEDALALAEELGDEVAAGVYFDQGAERMVVAVTEPEATDTVIEAGSLVHVVEHSTAELDAIHEAFGAEFDVPDLAWGVDVLNNQVTITAGPLVSAADLAAIEDFAASHGNAVAFETTDSSFVPRIRGGDKINPRAFADPEGNCTLGFNVRDKDNPNSLSFVTAGHCTVPTVEAGNRDWVNSSNVYIGYTTGGFFPGNDFGLVRHNNASIAKPGNVDIDDRGGVLNITHSRDAYVDEIVCANGMSSAYNCGWVLSRNVSINYSGYGTVHGLTRTNVCTIGGDSGGPLIHGEAALGLLSGGPSNDNCDSYYQPVNEALAWYGVEVY